MHPPRCVLLSMCCWVLSHVTDPHHTSPRSMLARRTLNKPCPGHSCVDAQYGMDGMGRRGLLLSLVDRAGPVNGVSGVTKAEFVNRWEVRARHESVCLRFMRIVTIPAAGQPGSRTQLQSNARRLHPEPDSSYTCDTLYSSSWRLGKDPVPLNLSARC